MPGAAQSHDDNLLGPVYRWVYGGAKTGFAENRRTFDTLGADTIRPLLADTGLRVEAADTHKGMVTVVARQ